VHETRQTPVHPPCCSVKALPFILPRYSTSGGNICQSTGQSWYDRLPGLPYFTGMRLVLSKACHSTVRAFRPYSLTTQTGKLSTSHHSAALSDILIVIRKGKETQTYLLASSRKLLDFYRVLLSTASTRGLWFSLNRDPADHATMVPSNS
jgi:hypothetical protein